MNIFLVISTMTLNISIIAMDTPRKVYNDQKTHVLKNLCNDNDYDLEQVRQLVIEGADPNVPVLGWYSLLSHVTHINREDLVHCFIQYGADPCHENGRETAKPLELAVFGSNLSLTEVLLNRGANIHLICTNKYTILGNAIAWNCDYHMILLLLSYNAPIDIAKDLFVSENIKKLLKEYEKQKLL